MAEDSHEKSHDPTPHRRQEAREKGQVARSQDLSSAWLLLSAAVLLWWQGTALVNFFGLLAVEQMGTEAWLSVDSETITGRLFDIGSKLAGVMVPFLGLLLVMAVFTNVLQVGLLFLPDKLMPELSRIDPLKGMGRIFSLSSAMRLFFGLVKLAIVGIVAYVSLIGHWPAILALTGADTGATAGFLLELLYDTTVKIAAALVVLAILDYAFQWWKQEKDLRMTTQEMREEMKNLQGDPQVAARRKTVQRQLVANRLKTVVPKADVVITNPTELAIAIQYDIATMRAPIVVAKGAGVLAQRIRRLALENGVPILERKPLAQALYKEVDVNRPIPHTWYAAVADILAYVYQLKGKKIPDSVRKAG